MTKGRQLRIRALAQALRSHGYAVEVSESEPVMTIPAAFGPPVILRCDVRTTFKGEPWFFFAGGSAIVPADDDHLHDVVVAVKGKLAAQTDA